MHSWVGGAALSRVEVQAIDQEKALCGAPQPEFVRDFFGDHQADRAGVHDPLDGRPSDLGFAAVSSVHQWQPCWFPTR